MIYDEFTVSNGVRIAFDDEVARKTSPEEAARLKARTGRILYRNLYEKAKRELEHQKQQEQEA